MKYNQVISQVYTKCLPTVHIREQSVLMNNFLMSHHYTIEYKVFCSILNMQKNLPIANTSIYRPILCVHLSK